VLAGVTHQSQRSMREINKFPRWSSPIKLILQLHPTKIVPGVGLVSQGGCPGPLWYRSSTYVCNVTLLHARRQSHNWLSPPWQVGTLWYFSSNHAWSFLCYVFFLFSKINATFTAPLIPFLLGCSLPPQRWGRAPTMSVKSDYISS
jgi:hypothetical protein